MARAFRKRVRLYRSATPLDSCEYADDMVCTIPVFPKYLVRVTYCSPSAEWNRLSVIDFFRSSLAWNAAKQLWNSEQSFFVYNSANSDLSTMHVTIYLDLPPIVCGRMGPTILEWMTWSSSTWASLLVQENSYDSTGHKFYNFHYVQIRLDRCLLHASQTLTVPFLCPHVQVSDATAKRHLNDFKCALLWAL